jgi:signal transduction histidine kinase
MSHPVATLAALLREGSDEIVRRWLERITARVSLDRDIVFPSESLIDDVPLLIAGLAQHVEDETEEISRLSAVVGKARELGRLRFEQAVSARQILWEYEILGALTLRYLEEQGGLTALPADFVRRFTTALALVQRNTAEEYFLLLERQSAQREDRLRGFNRALSHEVRNDVGAILGAARMLQESFVVEDAAQRGAFLDMIIDNAENVERIVSNLLQLAVLDTDLRRNRHVLLEHAVAEVLRRLRTFAESRGVDVRVAGCLPAIEVNAAVVDLALTNLVANAVKYARPDSTDRRVRITASANPHTGMVTVEVTDNGTGVPEHERPQLFEKFFRATTHRCIDGTGLGLALVRETVERLGGRAWADFPECGETIFAFTLPARRGDDPA